MTVKIYWKTLTPLFLSLIFNTYAQDDSARFALIQTEENRAIADKSLKYQFVLPQEWFEVHEEASYFDNAINTIERIVPYYQINDSLLVLVVSDFSTAGKFASGHDFFIIYKPKNGSIEKFSFTNEAVRGRYPGPCRGAYETFYGLADINRDGHLDLGVITEEIKCDWSGDIPITKQYYVQHPVEWYIWHDGTWQLYQNVMEQKPEDFEIHIDRYPGPVDVTGYNLWKHYNPIKWPMKTEVYPKFWSYKRLEKAMEEAKRNGDTEMMTILNQFKIKK